MCQRTAGVEAGDVASRSLSAGLAFAKAAAGRGLTIAAKSVVVANVPRLADYLAREYREAGFSVEAGGSTEMLGVRTQLNGSRNLTTYKARWQKFRTRFARISQLSRVTKQAAKLFTGHVAVAAYGNASIGTDPRQQKQLVQAGSKAAGKHGLQPCPISVCAPTFHQLP